MSSVGSAGGSGSSSGASSSNRSGGTTGSGGGASSSTTSGNKSSNTPGTASTSTASDTTTGRSQSRTTSDTTALSPETKEKTTAGSTPDLGALASSFAETPAAAEKTAQLAEALGSGTLRSGQTDPAVAALQGALNEKLGLELETDGKFGPKTKEAVQAFQRQNGLEADGVVGKDTRGALLGGNTAPAQETQQPQQRDALGYQALNEALGDQPLSPGMRNNESVKALQGALNESLGLELATDGDYGRKTADAVRSFQEKQGLPATGELDARTKEALLGPEPPKTREQLQDMEAARQFQASQPKPDMIFSDRLNPEEQAKVREVAQALGADPNDLMAVMAVETGGTFDPAQRAHGNPNGAVGLIQFTGTALEEMNKQRAANGQEPLTKAALEQMSFVEQMDHVQTYLQDNLSARGVTNPGRDDLYTAVFAPAAVNKSDGSTVYRAGTDAYAANSSLDVDGNGRITRGEVVDRVDEWYDRGMAGLS